VDTPHHEEAERQPEHHVRVTIRILGEDGAPFHLELEREAPLRQVLERGLEHAGKQLVPPPDVPLDRLHSVQHHVVGPVITDLAEPLWKYLREPHTTHDFAIELVRAFRVNTRWAVAPTEQMTPHQILDLVALEYTEFTLYPHGGAQFLPLEEPVSVTRGTVFEAQRDGRYGCA
jgi:hypothetical protein